MEKILATLIMEKLRATIDTIAYNEDVSMLDNTYFITSITMGKISSEERKCKSYSYYIR